MYLFFTPSGDNQIMQREVMPKLCKIIADSKFDSLPLLHSSKEPPTSMQIGNTVFGMFALARCKSGLGVEAPWTDWQRTNIVGLARRLISLMLSLLRDLRTALCIFKFHISRSTR
jgi:hypothetical protein